MRSRNLLARTLPTIAQSLESARPEHEELRNGHATGTRRVQTLITIKTRRASGPAAQPSSGPASYRQFGAIHSIARRADTQARPPSARAHPPDEALAEVGGVNAHVGPPIDGRYRKRLERFVATWHDPRLPRALGRDGVGTARGHSDFSSQPHRSSTRTFASSAMHSFSLVFKRTPRRSSSIMPREVTGSRQMTWSLMFAPCSSSRSGAAAASNSVASMFSSTSEASPSSCRSPRGFTYRPTRPSRATPSGCHHRWMSSIEYVIH